jgi:voltage-gated potassium channel
VTDDVHHEVRLPRAGAAPLRAILVRVGFAVALVVFVALVAYVGRDGYRDADGGEVGLLDAFYYATVSITTTGYGDITPVTEGTRLATVLLITPARVLFLILLVGTTLEFLAERSRQAFLRRRWRARVRDHAIVCGYGTKGRSAVRVLLAQDYTPDRVVVIDRDPTAVARANAAGLTGIVGDAATTDALQAARIDTARTVVVAPDRDDAAVLTTLTARELNRRVTIVAAVREAENAHLLRQGGADSVIVSAEAAGRLLGLATQSPQAVELLDDLLTVGEGLDVSERPVRPEEVGGPAREGTGEVVLGVVRDGELIRSHDPRCRSLQPGDRVMRLLHVGLAPERTEEPR